MDGEFSHKINHKKCQRHVFNGCSGGINLSREY